jgi:hypothetical protein
MDYPHCLIKLDHDPAHCDCMGDHADHYYFVLEKPLQVAFFECLKQLNDKKDTNDLSLDIIQQLRVIVFGSLTGNEDSTCDVMKWKLLGNVPLNCLYVFRKINCVQVNDTALSAWIGKHASVVTFEKNTLSLLSMQ